MTGPLVAPAEPVAVFFRHDTVNLLMRTSLLLITLLCVAAHADEPGSFARVAHDANGEPTALQLAIVTYAAADGRYTVDLIGAVHIGEAAYYAALNERFVRYDALLYELVTPDREQIPSRDDSRRGFLSGTQIAMTDLLDLSFQLDEIDYQQPNFVHADLTSDELAESMAERNESLLSYLWHLYVAAIRESASDPLGIRSLHSLSALFSGDDDLALKKMLAYELAAFDERPRALGGLGTTAIIEARNERAVEVLREAVDRGAEQVGIFYGVGHMPDLSARLIAELGLAIVDVEWIDAWDLAPEDTN